MLRTPTIVRRRDNIAVRCDPVTMDEHLAIDYKSKLGVTVLVDPVLNNWCVEHGADICHKSYGYLRTPKFSKLLSEFI